MIWPSCSFQTTSSTSYLKTLLEDCLMPRLLISAASSSMCAGGIFLTMIFCMRMSMALLWIAVMVWGGVSILVSLFTLWITPKSMWDLQLYLKPPLTVLQGSYSDYSWFGNMPMSSMQDSKDKIDWTRHPSRHGGLSGLGPQWQHWVTPKSWASPCPHLWTRLCCKQHPCGGASEGRIPRANSGAPCSIKLVEIYWWTCSRTLSPSFANLDLTSTNYWLLTLCMRLNLVYGRLFFSTSFVCCMPKGVVLSTPLILGQSVRSCLDVIQCSQPYFQ